MNPTQTDARRIVLTYGRFDRFDQADIDDLRQASSLGDLLLVGCATDGFAESCGMPCAVPFALRRARLEKCLLVDRVIQQECLAQIRTDIVNYNANLLVVRSENVTEYAHLQDIAQVVCFKRHTRISSHVSQPQFGADLAVG